VKDAARAAALALAWLGVCRPAAAAEEPRPIRSALGEPGSLDPARARSVHEQALVVQLFSRLLECDAAGLRPSLAREWTVSPDGRVYSFELAAARFHDGREVEAEDVAGSLRRLIAAGRLAIAGELASLVEGGPAFASGKDPALAGVRVLGPKRLEIRLSEPYAPLPSLLCAPALSVVPAAQAQAAGEGFGRRPIGSGPFRLERWDESEILLRANDGAPEGAPLASGVSYRLLPAGGAVARILTLLNGRELDFVLLPPRMATDAQALPRGYRRETRPELAVFYIGFNTGAGAAADARVRRAFRAGLDRAALAREMFVDDALVTDSMIPRGLPGARRDVPGPDAGAARALLRELASEGRRPRLRLHYAEGRATDPGFEWLAGRMSELGLDVVLSPSPSLRELLVLQEQGRVEAWLGGVQAEYPEPESLLRGLFGGRGRRGNWFAYSSPEVDRLLDAARAARDAAERGRLYAGVDEAIERDVPAIPLWGRSYQYFVASDVRGLELSYLPFQVRLAGVSLGR
jgi:peptide/nickel transport system substrate-binding protein/oligopeptide transport system substrate-binding protein